MPTEDEIVALSRQLIERGSKSFAGAARLFDPGTRDSAYMLYAWCRHCDDVIDDQELGFARAPDRASSQTPHDNLATLDRKTREALAGRADEPVFIALERVVRQHGIPHMHPLELIEGFRMDVEGFRPKTLDDTLTYCYHVAGVVGVMMAMIMGARGPDALNRAADLGIAFQLTNIVRDIVSDAEAGRVYLPSEWLDRAGLATADLAEPAHRATLFAEAARLLDIADTYYASAGPGIHYLPFRSAWAVASARNIYRGIGGVVRKRREAAWDQRARVGAGGKLAGVARGLGRACLASLPFDTVPGRGTQGAPSRQGLWTRPGLGQDG